MYQGWRQTLAMSAWRIRFSSFPLNCGYENKITPKIIRHPANCQLMRHNDNVSKYSKCSITLDELKERIENWDLKYGFVVESVDTSDSKPDIERCASSTLAEVTNVIRGGMEYSPD